MKWHWGVLIGAVLGLHMGCVGGGGHARDGGAGHSGFGGGGTGGFSGVAGGIGGTGGFPLDAGFDAGGPNLCSFCPAAPPGPASAFLTPCCTVTGGCGLSSSLLFAGCLDLRDPGHVDVACPASSAMLVGGLDGCCNRRGMCGISLSALGLGCLERGDVIGSPLIQLEGPVDISCGFSSFDGGGPSDAGDDEDAGETSCQWTSCQSPAVCVVRDGLERCECGPGYATLSSPGAMNIQCRDINECLLSSTCAAGTCVNTPGGFRCDAPDP